MKKRMSNIEKCEKYMQKQGIIGSKIFDFELNRETDEVLLKRYYTDNRDFRVIEIPEFVTGIAKNDVGVNEVAVFAYVNQSLKVINKSHITNMNRLFSRFNGRNLDLSEFRTDGVLDMSYMFDGCHKLKELDLTSFNFKGIEYKERLFHECYKLDNLKTTDGTILEEYRLERRQ